MSLSSLTEIIPLEADSSGVVRVGKTRVTLDTIVAAFCEGATAEEIAHQYPSLNLADVYHVIGYYLRRTSEVEQYLRDRRTKAQAVQRENDGRFDPQGVRDRLLSRRSRRAQ